MILIMGSKEDQQIISIANQLDIMKKQYRIFDSSAFPQKDSIGYRPESGELAVRINNENILLSSVSAMYWRNYMQPVSNGNNPLAIRDCTSLLMSLLNELGCKAKNSAEAVRFHQEKPRQLAVVAKLGVCIPATYVGNDIHEVQAFCCDYDQIIFKPVTGGDYAQLVTSSHLSKEHLCNSLSQSPVTLQQYIRGTNIRSYVIGDDIFSAEILSEQADFRTDEKATLQVLDIPEHIKQQARKITAALGLAWTAIDWRRDENGKYFFLEANPSPMFVNFEKFTGLPVAQHLAKLLAA